jgi:hypothetical protein
VRAGAGQVAVAERRRAGVDRAVAFQHPDFLAFAGDVGVQVGMLVVTAILEAGAVGDEEPDRALAAGQRDVDVAAETVRAGEHEAVADPRRARALRTVPGIHAPLRGIVLDAVEVHADVVGRNWRSERGGCAGRYDQQRGNANGSGKPPP